MGATMNTSLSAAWRIAACLALLSAAPCHAAAPAAAPAAPPASILELPLQPVVSAAMRSCQSKTASGLGYTVLRPATGVKPGARDAVLVNYIGYLAASGETFDQNMRVPMMVENVVPGFSEGLLLMPRGSIYRLCLPAALGYGAKAQGPIPANSDLVFQVELLDSKTMAEIEAMQKAQAAQQPAKPDPKSAAPKP